LIVFLKTELMSLEELTILLMDKPTLKMAWEGTLMVLNVEWLQPMSFWEIGMKQDKHFLSKLKEDHQLLRARSFVDIQLRATIMANSI
jgi:hypothetical protein